MWTLFQETGKKSKQYTWTELDMDMKVTVRKDIIKDIACFSEP